MPNAPRTRGTAANASQHHDEGGVKGCCGGRAGRLSSDADPRADRRVLGRDAGQRLGEGSELSRPKCVIDWPCSGEQIVGPSDFAAIQSRYPTNTGRWSFDVHRLVVEGDTPLSEVTVTAASSRWCAALLRERWRPIVRQVEYWPIAYEPLPGREDLTRPTARVP